MRLFIGIPMPDDVADRLIMLSGGIPGARWIVRENLHLTLRFLGDAEPGQIEDLIGALDRLPLAVAKIQIAGLGLFGDRRRQQQLYADVKQDPELTRLNQKIEQMAQHTDFEPEGRRFHPHVTLARMRNPDKRRLGQYLEANGQLALLPFQTTGFTLFRSHLSSEGAMYEPLVEFNSEQTASTC
jgi:2'-5' RNA ligase